MMMLLVWERTLAGCCFVDASQPPPLGYGTVHGELSSLSRGSGSMAGWCYGKVKERHAKKGFEEFVSEARRFCF